jgi:DNA-binding FadR family transcriptional regulator
MALTLDKIYIDTHNNKKYCILNLLFDKDNLDNEIIDELLIFRRNLEIAILKLAVKKVVPMDIRRALHNPLIHHSGEGRNLGSA